MITVGSSSGTSGAGDALPEASKRRIPLVTIPITLAVGLLVGVVYVGNRIFASKTHATVVVVSSLSRSEISSPVAPNLASQSSSEHTVDVTAPAALPVDSPVTEPKLPGEPDHSSAAPASKSATALLASTTLPAPESAPTM